MTSLVYVHVVVADNASIVPSFNRSNLVLPVIGINLILSLSPNIATANDLQISASNPSHI